MTDKEKFLLVNCPPESSNLAEPHSPVQVQQKLSREMVTLTSEIYSLGEVTRAANTARSAAQHACLAVLSQVRGEATHTQTCRLS